MIKKVIFAIVAISIIVWCFVSASKPTLWASPAGVHNPGQFYVYYDQQPEGRTPEVMLMTDKQTGEHYMIVVYNGKMSVTPLTNNPGN